MKKEVKITKEEETPTVVVLESAGGGPGTKEHQELMEQLRKPVMSLVEENAQKRKNIEERLEEIELSKKGFIDDKEKDSLENDLEALESSSNNRNKTEVENKSFIESEKSEKSDKEVVESLETGEKLSMDTAKDAFISKYTDYLKTRKLRESLGISKKEKDWPDDLKDLMSKYRDSKVSYMQIEYDNKKQELFSDMSDMSGDGDIDIEAAQKANETMDKEFFTAKIFSEVELSQQEEIQKARVEALGVKEKTLFMKGAQWYSKRSLISKAAFTAAVGTGVLIGSGAFAGATLGVGAAAGIYAGQKIVRSLVGTLAGTLFGKIAGRVGENVVDRIDKKSEKEFLNKFDVRSLDKMEELSRKRLDKVESAKTKAFLAKMAVSVSAAIIAGRLTGDLLQSVDKIADVGTLIPQTHVPSSTGAAKDKIAEKIHNVVSGPQSAVQPTNVPGAEPQSAVHAPVQPTNVPGAEHLSSANSAVQGASEVTASVHNGDSMWKIIENKLQSQGDFKGLNEGQRTYLIDTFKDKITAMSPDKLKEIGILSGDPNVLKAGEHIDLTSVLGNTEVVQNAKHASEMLSNTASKAIEANNLKISDWASAHPHEAITSDRIKDILSGNANQPQSAVHAPVQPTNVPGAEHLSSAHAVPAPVQPTNVPGADHLSAAQSAVPSATVNPDDVGKHITGLKTDVNSSSGDNWKQTTTTVDGIMNRYSGKEFLSKNYMRHLDLVAGVGFAKEQATAASRVLSTQIANYDHLKSIGELKKASTLLKAIHTNVSMYDTELGKGIIDHSKIPGMK